MKVLSTQPKQMHVQNAGCQLEAMTEINQHTQPQYFINMDLILTNKGTLNTHKPLLQNNIQCFKILMKSNTHVIMACTSVQLALEQDAVFAYCFYLLVVLIKSGEDLEAPRWGN
jgi:hypothetical protein